MLNQRGAGTRRLQRSRAHQPSRTRSTPADVQEREGWDAGIRGVECRRTQPSRSSRGSCALKARDGRSYEALGRRLSISASTLHRYCSGATVPEEFAVVDRLALLCGTDEEERRALEAAWTQADRARRGAASPTPPPVPAVSATPESNPEPPAPKPSLDPAPNPTAPQAPRARPRRGTPALLLAAVAVAVALVMLVLTAALLAHPARTASAPAPADPGRTAHPPLHLEHRLPALGGRLRAHLPRGPGPPAQSPQRRSPPTPGRGPGRTMPCTAAEGAGPDHGPRPVTVRRRHPPRPARALGRPPRCRGTHTEWTTAVEAPSPRATSPWTSTGPLDLRAAERGDPRRRRVTMRAGALPPREAPGGPTVDRSSAATGLPHDPARSAARRCRARAPGVLCRTTSGRETR
ncbi:helix-turn-helix domain-containing protein [Streptomyces sp. NPDC018007]|uniref:helix-turn-helix domain-containing protein n=1 Tax=Streptomyces sp. NPDC018007 TaxID=3365029 RepID=UPI003796F407